MTRSNVSFRRIGSRGGAAACIAGLAAMSACAGHNAAPGMAPSSEAMRADASAERADRASSGPRPQLVPQVGHTNSVHGVAVSANGRTALSVGMDQTLRVWDLESRALLRTLTGHEGGVRAVAFVDDHRAITASEDKTLIVWDVVTGARLRTLSGHTAAVVGVAVTPDGTRAVSASHDHTAIVWDLTTGALLRTFKTHTDNVLSVALSMDGTQALTGDATGVVQLWDVATGGILRTLTGKVSVHAVAFAPDGHRALAATSYDGTELWDLDHGAVVRLLKADEPTGLAAAIAFLPDGQHAISASWDTTLRIWDVETGKLVSTLAGHTKYVESVAVFAGGHRALSGGYDRTVKLWDLDTRAPIYTFEAKKRGIHSVAYSKDGRRAFTASDDQKVRVWDVTSAALVRVLDDGGSAESSVVAVSPDGTRLAAASTEVGKPSVVTLWDLASANVLRTVTVDRAVVSSIVFSPDGKRILAGGIMTAPTLIDVERGVVLGLLDRRESVTAAFSPDGRRILTSSGELVRVWDAATLAETRTLRGPRYSVTGIAVSPDGTRAIAGSADHKVWMWDLSTGEIIRSLEGHKAMLTSVAYSADGKTIVSASYDRTARLWDAASGAAIRPLEGHDDAVFSAVLSPDGTHAVTGSYDGTMRLFRTSDGASIAFTSQEDEWIAYDADGNFDASRHGGELLVAVEGMRVFRVDQLAASKNRPDLLLQRVGIGSPDLVSHYRARHEARLRKLGLDARHLDDRFSQAPDARLVSVDVHGAEATVTADLGDPNARLAHYNVYVNGVPVFGALGKPANGAAAHVVDTIALAPGRNKIEVTAFNAAGAESLRPFRVVTREVTGPVDLWYVGFGVSQYRNPKYDLGYPHKDVLDLGEVLRAETTAFRAVHMHTFVNEEATAAHVKQAKELLKAARPDDVVVVFVAGHGVHARDAAADYYFATHEVDVKRLPETAASFDVIEDLMMSVAPYRKLLLMDTCESGERDPADGPMDLTVSPDGAGSRGLRARTTRDLVFEASATSAHDPNADAHTPMPSSRPYLFDRERFVYNDLSRRSGTIVLSSSRGSELSWENDTLKNGVFTKELVRALVTPVADADHDATVTTEELRRYVANAVANYTAGKQHPTVDRDNVDARFGFPIVTAAAPVLTRADPLPPPDPARRSSVASSAHGADASDSAEPPGGAPPVRMPAGCGCRGATAPPLKPWSIILGILVGAAAWGRRSRRQQRNERNAAASRESANEP